MTIAKSVKYILEVSRRFSVDEHIIGIKNAQYGIHIY